MNLVLGLSNFCIILSCYLYSHFFAQTWTMGAYYIVWVFYTAEWWWYQLSSLWEEAGKDFFQNNNAHSIILAQEMFQEFQGLYRERTWEKVNCMVNEWEEEDDCIKVGDDDDGLCSVGWSVVWNAKISYRWACVRCTARQDDTQNGFTRHSLSCVIITPTMW